MDKYLQNELTVPPLRSNWTLMAWRRTSSAIFRINSDKFKTYLHTNEYN
jgi:hypothetical protein